MRSKKINEEKFDFTWNVYVWNINHDKIETYNVVPIFIIEYNRLKIKDIPQTKQDFSEFLKREAQYHFWAKCEYEVIVHGWPKFKNDVKIDVYKQLMLNWDIFVDCFWNKINKK